jgi:hypothetical protein
MFNKLKSFEEDCLANLPKINDLNEQYNKYLDSLNGECQKWKEEIRVPKMNASKLDEFNNLVAKSYRENQDKLVEYKNALQMNKKCSFIPKNFEFSSDLLGEFLIEESVAAKSMFNSRILTSEQSKILIKLCGFNPNDQRFKLLYRATKDGFKAIDFHRKCDTFAKTLTVIKVKDKSNIFGGYTGVYRSLLFHF